MIGAECSACRFYHPDVTTGRNRYSAGAGECRVNAPGVFPFEYAEGGSDAAFRMWPIVLPHDWCGCFTTEEHG